MSSEFRQELLKLRRALHSAPELSRNEEKTAEIIQTHLLKYEPDELITNLGGYGLAAIFHGKSPGLSILLRCELDGLQITEDSDYDYKSRNQGVTHACGHDGHMTIIAGIAWMRRDNLPAKGSVILLFQPSEETGEGAKRVLEDSRFAGIKPDYVFALHNLPGFPLGQVIVREGVFASASKGLIIELRGATSHAAEPEKGRSPTMAVAQLIQGLSSAPQNFVPMHENVKVTVIHAKIGEPAFGTSPGTGIVMATLRTHSDEIMDSLSQRLIAFIHKTASAYNLDVGIKWTEPFPVTVNDDDCVKIVEDSANSIGLGTIYPEKPFPWSEDFGHFTSRFRGALFGLGAGVDHPALHNPDYNFPDDLIEIGIKIYGEIIRRILD
ncbi:MAG: amidohydrolase [Candidatus Marinimicrobia bacterium]|nr:amidohydrolase [Candidatus Neomarinimicrobiota bacterium]